MFAISSSASASFLKNVPSFYQEIFTHGSKNLLSPATVPSTIISQFIWFNAHIKIESFFWIQVVNAMQKYWKESFSKDESNPNNLSVHDHHFIKRTQINSLSK